MDKAEELKNLEAEMAADNMLPLRESNLVFGEGSPDSKVMFIGEAPGFNEDREKRPFVGRAGQLLRKNLREMGWKENDVYITNIVKRRPPENRDPLPNEIAAYQPYLEKQIKIINPKIIAALGRFSMNYFLPEAKISRDQGKVFRFKNFLLVPIYHPAAALRSTEVLGEMQKSMKQLPKILEKADEFLAQSRPEQPEKKEQTVQKKLF
ncbi:MAG: uracil-DNA glycosylase [Candidatus Liptonbacteria bacterium]|nr:uracil-DNA glycosylase [Candidatus Liptonbacteria bacterium]